MKLPTNTVSPPRIGLWSLPPWRYRNPVLTWSIHSSLNELKSSSSRPPSGIACGGLFIVLKDMYIYMSNSKLKLTCHKLNLMSVNWRLGQSFFFLLAELPLSLTSVNRCENRIAFILDILIPRFAFLMFPSLCVLRLFHRICTPNLFMLLLSFRPSFNGYGHDVCASLVYLI